jgi:hypothetical protein
MTRDPNALMSWWVLLMPVMDLVDLDLKQIESPLPQGRDSVHHA